MYVTIHLSIHLSIIYVIYGLCIYLSIIYLYHLSSGELCHDTHVEVERKLVEISSLFMSYVFHGWNSSVRLDG